MALDGKSCLKMYVEITKLYYPYQQPSRSIRFLKHLPKREVGQYIYCMGLKVGL